MRAATLQGAARSLLALTAADLMTAPVMTLPQETSLREAARLLHGSHISGAPVVDAGGRCVGVLSSSDFVTWAENPEGETGKAGKATTFIAPWGELVSIDDSPDHPISRYMTAQPVTVPPSTPIGELCQQMVDVHIHRVLVVADGETPCGIVTSTDVLAAVARAAHKAAQQG
jgi:CBS domain-containing protein